MSILKIRKSTLERLYLVPRVNASRLLLINKQSAVRGLFYFGMLIAFFTSATPWFLWGLYRYYVLFADVFLIGALLFSQRIEHGIFRREDAKYPTLACFALLIVMAIDSGKNVNGFLMTIFQLVIYFSLFKVNRQELYRLSDFLTKALALLLAVSIAAYVLYFLGFPFPHHHVITANRDYSFENYYFFMIDDRFSLDLMLRFHSVFLEPAHMAMACIALLYSQIGKWNTWRCRVLFLAILMSFSLAGYICMIAMFFSASWMKGKAILGKIIALVVVCATILVGSIFYKQGDNLINVFIVQRLTTNDQGSIEGDNRTTDIFTREYDKLTSSAEVLVGKGSEAMEKYGSGNAGYRVFIYTYGLFSVLFLIIFFYMFLRTTDNRRAAISMLVISGLSFIAHGIPVKFYLFIPLYILAFSDVYPKQKKAATEEAKA